MDPGPLTPYEEKARNHALLSSIGFLVILPIGSLFARYARTYTKRWMYIHWSIQFLIAGPVIVTGWVLGYQLAQDLGYEGFQSSPHQQIGLALLVLYLVQVFLGPIVHWFKFQKLLRGHRPPHSYLHAIIGLTIIALASYQVHYGLVFEWIENVQAGHPIPQSALNAWLALTILFWVLYGLGLGLLPRQFRLESEFRKKL